MRILWHSVAPWIKTGYGTQTEIFTRRLRDLLGHDVAISSWTLQGNMTEYRGLRIYPHGGGRLGEQNDKFGNEIIAHHARHWRADLVVTLTDVWVFRPESMKKIPWAPWTPIDHDPVPPKVLSSLKYGYAVPVGLTRFGQEQLNRAGLSALYVPHGCHETYFEKITKKAARQALNLPQEAFIVGMVGVNQGAPNRKSYPLCIEAFQRFNKRHPDSFLYMHTLANSPQGVNLEHLIEHLKLDSSVYRFPDPYDQILGLSETYLRNVYTAIDVFLTPNIGEGFGIPIIEAQACGAPIIGTDFSTMPELRQFGELIPGEPFYTSQASFQYVPTVDRIHSALKKIYGYTRDDYKKGSARARRNIRKFYHPDTITKNYWEPALREAKARIGEWDYQTLGSKRCGA